MKFSKYNECFELNGSYYLYNILSTAIAEIDLNLCDAINKNSLSSLDGALIIAMKDKHFIVDDDLDEVQEYMYFYNSIRYGVGSQKLGITFIPTYNCNLSCPYCMQGLNKNRDMISEEAMESLLKYVRNTVEESHINGVPITELDISLFGGEPLLAKKTFLPAFCKQIKKTAENYNCSLIFSMTSNFTLLDDEMIDFIKLYDIQIQVSIDGDKEQHDKRRISPEGKGTYDIIMSNLKKMNLAGLKKNLTIRINLDRENLDRADSIMSSVSDLADDIYFGYLDNFKGCNDDYLTCLEHNYYADIMNNELIPIYLKYGKIVPRSFGKMTPCSMHCENRFIIDLYLNVYKCELLINKKEACVGHIENDGMFIPNSNFYAQMDHTPDKINQCRDCKLLPLCGGGCTGKAYVNSNESNRSFTGISCKMREEDLIKYLQTYVSRKLYQ